MIGAQVPKAGLNHHEQICITRTDSAAAGGAAAASGLADHLAAAGEGGLRQMTIRESLGSSSAPPSVAVGGDLGSEPGSKGQFESRTAGKLPVLGCGESAPGDTVPGVAASSSGGGGRQVSTGTNMSPSSGGGVQEDGDVDGEQWQAIQQSEDGVQWHKINEALNQRRLSQADGSRVDCHL